MIDGRTEKENGKMENFIVTVYGKIDVETFVEVEASSAAEAKSKVLAMIEFNELEEPSVSWQTFGCAEVDPGDSIHDMQIQSVEPVAVDAAANA
jgi:hypothetical protein